MRNTFRIDMSSLIDKDEFPASTAGIGKHQFNYHYVIGKGGFGKVWSVEFKKNRIYAMKEMVKTKIIGKKSINSVMNERLLLSTLKHPFIVNMNYAFQDR
jgi:serine/threonine protein kinase